MIDIHCHILPAMDDGAEDWEEALEMARIAYADGIRVIIATPHFNDTFLNKREQVEQKTVQLQALLKKEGIGVRVLPGNEVRIESPAFVREHWGEQTFSLLGPTGRFVLLEQRWRDFEADSPALIESFMAEGIRPIIPHPERHYYFREDPSLLEDLLAKGAWTQVSADSLAGRNNEEALALCRWLCDRDYVHTLATDAHNTRRKPNLSEGFGVIREWAGDGRVRAILDRMESIAAE